jgi:hypothetical protein
MIRHVRRGFISEGAFFEKGFMKAALAFEGEITRISVHRITQDWQDLQF